jgi:hypothetical protein
VPAKSLRTLDVRAKKNAPEVAAKQVVRSEPTPFEAGILPHTPRGWMFRIPAFFRAMKKLWNNDSERDE